MNLQLTKIIHFQIRFLMSNVKVTKVEKLSKKVGGGTWF